MVSQAAGKGIRMDWRQLGWRRGLAKERETGCRTKQTGYQRQEAVTFLPAVRSHCSDVLAAPIVFKMPWIALAYWLLPFLRLLF